MYVVVFADFSLLSLENMLLDEVLDVFPEHCQLIVVVESYK